MKQTHMMYIWLLLLLAGLTATTPAAAQTNERCFAETGYCISGPIRAYWEANGGLPVFGYPISSVETATVEGWTGPVQWFERDRLEIQADGTITAGRLGDERLMQLGIDWQTLQRDTAGVPGCRFFPETGFNLCAPFLSYWERNGGLERFGYPITSGTEEIVEGRTYAVQYFERRRMELHPNPERGTPDVLLGLLGRDVLAYRQSQSPTVPACAVHINPNLLAVYTSVQLGYPVGCPTRFAGNDVPAATQAMERGHMIWFGWAEPAVDAFSPSIFAIIAHDDGSELSFRTYPDTWVAGQDPDTPAGNPPQPDLFPPWRGFGKVWSQDTELRSLIGWARAAQASPNRIDYQHFESGILLVHLRDGRSTYAFGNPSNPREVQFIR